MAIGFLGPQTSHLPRSLNLADAASQKISEIGAGKAVQLTFSDKGSDEYLFISGHASVSNDRAKISDLWSVFAKAWWDSADDPSIRLISVIPQQAEYWDGPNRLVAAGKMLFAAVTGGRLDMGENRKTSMQSWLNVESGT